MSFYNIFNKNSQVRSEKPNYHQIKHLVCVSYLFLSIYNKKINNCFSKIGKAEIMPVIEILILISTINISCK